MFLLNALLSKEIISINILFTSILVFSALIISSFLRRRQEKRESFKKRRREKEQNKEERALTIEDRKKVELKTIVIEQPELENEVNKFNLEQQKKETLLIPSKIKNQIEKSILKILYQEKSVKTLKLLNDKFLESAAKQKVTISEKVINLIINQMNKIGKIEFTQKEGWKIKI
jgi:hypothetical protein